MTGLKPLYYQSNDGLIQLTDSVLELQLPPSPFVMEGIGKRGRSFLVTVRETTGPWTAGTKFQAWACWLVNLRNKRKRTTERANLSEYMEHI